MSNEISRLFVTISARTDEFTKGMDGVMGKVNQFGKYAAIAGTAIVGAMGAATMSFASTADNIQEMSQRSGLSYKKIQELGYAAKLSGSSTAGLETAMKRMQKTLFDAKNGSATATQSFTQLGIKLEDIQGLNPDEQFDMLAGAIAEIQDPTDRAAMAIELFGRSGTDMLPMLANGKQGLTDMAAEANKLNAVIGNDAVNAGAKMQDKIDAMTAAMEGFKNKIGEALAPQITAFIEKLTEIIVKFSDWAKQNPETLKTIFEVAAGIVILVGVLKSVAVAMALVQALSGPKGWLTLAAAALIAGGAIYGIDQLLKTPTIPGVPGMAAGGVVSSPTLAMIGEAGPEAVIPLGQLSQGNNEIHTHLYLDGEQIAEVVDKRLFDRINSLGAKGYV